VTGDGHSAADSFDAVSEADEPGTVGGIGATDSVVFNREVQPFGAGVHAHSHNGGLSVLGRVRKCFSEDVIAGHLYRFGHPTVDCEVEFHRYD
jgi:hypothetical protein